MLAYFDGNEFANELAESIKGYGHEPCLRTKKETKENKTLRGTQCVSNYEVVAYWLRAKPSSNPSLGFFTPNSFRFTYVQHAYMHVLGKTSAFRRL